MTLTPEDNLNGAAVVSAALGMVNSSPQSAYLSRHKAVMMNNYAQPQRVLVRGEGSYVWDADGNRYLDLLGGIAVNSLGHAHPTVVAAVTGQLTTLGHISNIFTSAPSIALATRLLDLTNAPVGSKVFFANSGTEALEAAIKIARRTGRPKIVALEGGFHGRSLGALSLTHKPAYRKPFEPLIPGVIHVPFGDIDTLDAALTDDVAAVVYEPIQGEHGVRVQPAGYLAALRHMTSERGVLMIADEVQTGIGRTGHWLASHHPEIAGSEPITPDVVTLAKGLGSGMPIGAVIAMGDHVAQLLHPGHHGSTFGGNPVATAAGLATLHVIERDGLLAHVTDTGAYVVQRIADAGIPGVRGVRGHGLLLAIELEDECAPAVAAAALDAGFIVNAVAPDALRLAPALNISVTQLDSFLEALPAIMRSVSEN